MNTIYLQINFKQILLDNITLLCIQRLQASSVYIVANQTISVRFLKQKKGFDFISDGMSCQIFGPQKTIDFFPVYVLIFGNT